MIHSHERQAIFLLCTKPSPAKAPPFSHFDPGIIECCGPTYGAD